MDKSHGGLSWKTCGASTRDRGKYNPLHTHQDSHRGPGGSGVEVMEHRVHPAPFASACDFTPLSSQDVATLSTKCGALFEAVGGEKARDLGEKSSMAPGYDRKLAVTAVSFENNTVQFMLKKSAHKDISLQRIAYTKEVFL